MGHIANDSLSDFVFGKVQPQAVPLEEAVLGAVMLDREAFGSVSELLRPQHFYLDAHQHIFQACLDMSNRSVPIDLLTLTEELKRLGTLDAIGGGYYLVELSNRVASSANIEHHARIIAQKHIQRELIRVATQTIRDAYEDTTDVFNLLDESMGGLMRIMSPFDTVKSMVTIGDAAQNVLKQIDRAMSGVGDAITTGLPKLDNLSGGFFPGELTIIAARPGMGKCLGIGTKVLMYDGTLKQVENIEPGELLMGPDSKPREVLSIARGREMMYWVRQNRGVDYRVNESHIISLKRSRTEWRHSNGDVLNIGVKDYVLRSNKFKTNYKGYKASVEFSNKDQPIDPYFIGLWLGDGRSSGVSICNKDKEIVDYLTEYAASLGLVLSKYESVGRCPCYGITKGNKSQGEYSLQSELSRIGLLNNKHIPDDYLINSEEKRLSLLAGLIDSDGHYIAQSNGFEITQKNEKMARQIKFLCDTLGFRTSLTAKKAQITSIGFECVVWRVRIYGDIDKVPVLVPRKKPLPWKSKINWKATGIKVEMDKVDDYYGFTIDGDRLFLLEDMTVTHNTELAISCAMAAAEHGKKAHFVTLEMTGEQLARRVMSSLSGVTTGEIRRASLDDVKIRALQSAAQQLAGKSLNISAHRGKNALWQFVRRSVAKKEMSILFVDYIQLMDDDEQKKNGNREQEVSAISRMLKRISTEFDIPVVILAQLSRQVEARQDKMPQLSDLRESGSLEQDADNVWFLMRPETYGIMELNFDYDGVLPQGNYNTAGKMLLYSKKMRSDMQFGLLLGFVGGHIVDESTRFDNHPGPSAPYRAQTTTEQQADPVPGIIARHRPGVEDEPPF